MKLLVQKLLPFLILLFAVLGCSEAGRQKHAKFEEREKVIELLNAKFSLRDSATVDQVVRGISFDCRFKFYMEKWANDKLLFVEFCESTSSAVKERKLADVLTPENLALLKNAEFERIELYDEKGRRADVATIP
jgi:hypothetical protein